MTQTTDAQTTDAQATDPLTGLPPDPALVQLLSHEGTRLHHPDVEADFSREELRAFYRDLVLVRRIDAEGTALQRQGELGLWAPLLGQEAAQVGAGHALAASDMVFPTYREHGIAWVKDVDPVLLLGMFRGVEHGGWDPADKGFGLYAIVLGAQVLHAVGYAMGVVRDVARGIAEPSAVLACFGDGATSQGDVNEAFVWAGAQRSPVVFFCQNNQWGISTPTVSQSRTPLYHRAEGFGFPGVRVDGNDVLATYAVVRDALARARRGEGPTLIEAYTYRVGPHTTSDDPTRYREPDELQHWKARDPIDRLRLFIERDGHADQAFFDGVDAEADTLAARIRAGCLALPDPDPLGAFDDVFVEQTEDLLRQQAAYALYLDGFAE